MRRLFVPKSLVSEGTSQYNTNFTWGIDLSTSKLRIDNCPDGCVEAILQIGKKLEQWSGEPEATMAVYNIFGLVPGEDRLFANTIFLRLAVAFQLGSKHTRVSIVRVFLSLHRHCKGKKKSKHVKGILSKSRIQNHLELLKRVKVVFDTGDPESRALALVLFGCCADFAKDSAQIRYLVLSTLVSSNDLEVSEIFSVIRIYKLLSMLLLQPKCDLF